VKLVAKFSVRGNPVSKARARVGERGAWTPEAVTAHEDKTRWAFLEQCKGVEVDHRARYRVMIAYVATDRIHRDVDNLAKLTLDALNGHIYKDDSQIDELSVRRVFVNDKTLGRTDVEVYQLEGTE
jgi:Holliday junction resolvase RusA-like endonuclease